MIFLKNEESLAVGNIFPEIRLPDLEGRLKSSNEFLGKYTLIYFWRSDCVYCNNEITALKNLYDQYHNRSFEIYSISLDDDRQKLLDNLNENYLPWIVVNDSLGWESNLVRNYNISGTPAKILLDPEGTIIARQISTAELEERLELLMSHQKSLI